MLAFGNLNKYLKHDPTEESQENYNYAASRRIAVLSSSDSRRDPVRSMASMRGALLVALDYRAKQIAITPRRIAVLSSSYSRRDPVRSMASR